MHQKNIMSKYKMFMLFLCIAVPAMSQQIIPLPYHIYMEKVTAGNLEYAAERLNVNVSEAEIVAAKIFNDPNLAVAYYNNENSSLQMGEGFEFELSKTFTFGKRSAGIRLAQGEKDLAEALLADYLRNLRAEATIAYLEALKQQELYRVKQDSYTNVRRLATSDSIRLALGKIMEIDATQSRLEAGIL
ncbi:MAG: TolC family protein, partial [Bacteroidales bacterium]|nr:TolC family protein [Bacteroidales bacterium]